jgi:hypothetical protein
VSPRRSFLIALAFRVFAHISVSPSLSSQLEYMAKHMMLWTNESQEETITLLRLKTHILKSMKEGLMKGTMTELILSIIHEWEQQPSTIVSLLSHPFHQVNPIS